jgi:antitoxin (DNA-binding transcriptional repressor) of toxin-antitoxin stability system
MVSGVGRKERAMRINASNLRKDIYRLLDRVLETGEPLEIERNGRLLKIVPTPGKSGKLSRLVRHDCIPGDAEELVHVDWLGEWSDA